MRIRRFFAVALACCALLLLRESSFLPHGSVSLTFFDVGQGDSALIVTPAGSSILIDGGPDLRTLEHLGSHLSFFDRSLDLLIVSHPDLDHIASFPEILKRYEVRTVLLPAAPYDRNGRARHMIDLLKTHDVPVLRAARGDRLETGDGVVLDVLWPPREGYETDDVNDYSVVLRVQWNGHVALFMGDASAGVEADLLRRGTHVQADILKVGHHGSSTSSSDAFIQAVRASDAVISAGRDNRFGHPHPDVLEILQRHGLVLHDTREGTVEFRWR